MTTPRDLFLISMDVVPARPVEHGDLSLGLAGAEVIDLLDARAVRLDGVHILPMDKPVLRDRLLADAAATIVGQAPHESVSDWLWRRGRNLSAAYQAQLEADGRITRHPRRRWMLFRTTRTALADSPERRWATDRWRSGEPVLDSLGATVGLSDPPADDAVTDEAVATVLDAVDEAVAELAVERRRRAEAAKYNRQRGY